MFDNITLSIIVVFLWKPVQDDFKKDQSNLSKLPIKASFLEDSWFMRKASEEPTPGNRLVFPLHLQGGHFGW